MNYAQAVCDALDQIEHVPFGRMNEYLDKIAEIALKASLDHAQMVAALDEISKRDVSGSCGEIARVSINRLKEI